MTASGWVVCRVNGFGAWYVVSKRVFSCRLSAAVDLVDDSCEVVVPWQGDQLSTLEFRSAQGLLPKGQVAVTVPERCRGCGHLESEHEGLGCRHWNRLELRQDHADGSTTISTDLSECGCDYFRGPLS